MKLNRMLWTFGNHESLLMYRRIGRRSTGGVQGSAEWMESWHRRFDSEETFARMEEIGANILHCHFYKGMGWEQEKQDLPGLKKTLAAAHRHHITVLAYIQFATLYYELMQREIPNLQAWAARRSDNSFQNYNGDYFRWMPCPENREFRDYLKKIIRIAVETGFDGMMIDNLFGWQCYCPRCQEAFRNHLKTCNFDFIDPEYTRLPPPEAIRSEIEDPVVREMLRFGAASRAAAIEELCVYAHSLKPEFLTSGNWTLARRVNYTTFNNDPWRLRTTFDLTLAQSGNRPEASARSVISQVPELKFARAIGTRAVLLSDSDAGDTSDVGPRYLCCLYENLFGGSVPVDRTIFAPLRGGAFNEEKLKVRKPYLQRLRELAVEFEPLLEAENYEPVGLVYSRESIALSEASAVSFLRAQCSLLRNHIPFRILVLDATGFLRPDWAECTTILVPGARCLSDKVVEMLLAYRGRLILAGDNCGDYNEEYGLRAANPFPDRETLEIPAFPVLSQDWRLEVEDHPDRWGTLLRQEIGLDCPREAHAELKLAADGKLSGILLSAPCECGPGSVSIPPERRAAGYAAEFADGKRQMLEFSADGKLLLPPFAGMLLVHAL